MVTWNKSILFIVRGVVIIINITGSNHILQSSLLINCKVFGDSICHNRNSVIANHTPILITIMWPYRKHFMDTLWTMCHHRLYDIGANTSVYDSKQWMKSTICIPNWKDCVVSESVSVVNLMVDSTIVAVSIHIYRRINHRMIERCIKHSELIISSLSIDNSKSLFPLIIRFANKFIER